MKTEKDAIFIAAVLLEGIQDIIKDEFGNTKWFYKLDNGHIALDEDDDITILRPGRSGEIKYDLEEAISSQDFQLRDISNKLILFRKANQIVRILSPSEFVARVRARKAAKRINK